jgi:hypothetical protein
VLPDAAEFPQAGMERGWVVLIGEAGGAWRARPSRIEGKVDLVFGSPPLVDRISGLVGIG